MELTTIELLEIGRLILRQPEAEDVYIPGVIDVLESLPEKERVVLTQRYCKGKLIREIAAGCGLSEGHVDQLQRRALRLIRCRKHVQQVKAISMCMHYELVDKLRKGKAEVVDDTEGDVPVLLIEDKSLAELGLSTRTFNCLWRAQKRKVSDIFTMTKSDFSRLRNLGRGCLEEIVSKLAELGITIRD